MSTSWDIRQSATREHAILLSALRSHLLCAVFVVLLCAALTAGEMPSKDINSHGFIRSWLVCGPFHNPLPEGTTEYQFYRTLLGFDTDYLVPTGGESGTAPAEGLQFQASDGKQYTWTAYESPSDHVDLTSVFTKNTFAVAYAACSLVSDADKEVWLSLGSDDGIKVWLNGKLVWMNHIPRAARPDSELVSLPIKRGNNLLLLKVDQGQGDWGFYARIVDEPEEVDKTGKVAKGAMLQTPWGPVGTLTQDGRTDLQIGSAIYREVIHEAQPDIEYLPDEKSRGYVVYSRPASDGVYSNSRPKREEVTDNLSTFLTPGEKRHVTFTVLAGKDLGDVRVSCSGLRGTRGAVISPAQVSIRPVRNRYVRIWMQKQYHEVPKILDRPGFPTHIAADMNQTYWVSVDAPADARPDTYSGAIRISPRNGMPFEISLRVEVLPFKLDDAMWWGIYYYNANPGNDLMERDFADMRAHGVNALLYCPHPPNGLPPFTRQNDGIKVWFTHADRIFRLLKEYGFRSPTAYYPRLTSCRVLELMQMTEGFDTFDYYGAGAVRYKAEDYPDAAKPVLRDVFRQMIDHAAKAGWGELYWYLVDEPAAVRPAEMEWGKVEFPAIKEADSSAQTLCTIYDRETAEMLAPSVDVMVWTIDALRADPAIVPDYRAQGKQLFGIQWLCLSDSYWYTRALSGFVPEKFGLDGMTEWTYGVSSGMADPYEDFRNESDFGKSSAYAYTSPEDGSLLSTVTWEAVREGIDDSAYVRTLRGLIAEAEASGSTVRISAAGSARETLARAFGPEKWSDDWWNEENLNSIRRTIADEIVKLKSLR